MKSTPIIPYNRPRVQLATRMRHGTLGDCFPYAVKEVWAWIAAGKPGPAMKIVHGRSLPFEFSHAWIERGGYAYDWQTIALHKGEPVAVPVFLEKHRPLKRFDAEAAFRMMSKHNHFGPWL